MLEKECIDLEKILGISDIGRNRLIRPSADALDKIKRDSNENLNLIYKRLKTESEEEKRDIIVNLISALDYYIHALVIWGIIEITENDFPKGRTYDKFVVSIKYTRQALNGHEIDNEELRKDIIQILSKETYQKWESIRKGLQIILPKEVDILIGELTNGRNKHFKFTDELLKKLNDKRNSIVHNFDRDFNEDSQRNVFVIDCNEAYNYISLIINSIHEIIVVYDENQPESIE